MTHFTDAGEKSPEERETILQGILETIKEKKALTRLNGFTALTQIAATVLRRLNAISPKVQATMSWTLSRRSFLPSTATPTVVTMFALAKASVSRLKPWEAG